MPYSEPYSEPSSPEPSSPEPSLPDTAHGPDDCTARPAPHSLGASHPFLISAGSVSGSPPAPPEAPVSDVAQEPPFLIRVEHRDTSREGYFRPQAYIAFAAPLRLGGLLGALPPEACKDLLLLLSFVTPNGHFFPTLDHLAQAMHVSPAKARRRLERLESFRFHGQPLMARAATQSGLEFFTPLPWLAPVREDAEQRGFSHTAPPLQASSREAVIKHTRSAYTRPRAEVERQIEDMMGYRKAPVRSVSTGQAAFAGGSGQSSGDVAPGAVMPGEAARERSLNEAAPLSPEDARALEERAELKALLLQVGLLPEQAETLLNAYDPLRIRRQLAWLPYRGAKNPAGMLLAAVKDNYEIPQLARLHDPHMEQAPGMLTPTKREPQTGPTVRSPQSQEEVTLALPSE